MISHIMTHSGVFHADDVFAAATLRLCSPDAQLERTRDPDALERGRAASDTVVFDVGDHFEPERQNFDHHQRDFERTRSNGIPFAAFGLVWEHFGLSAVAHVLDVPEYDEAYTREVCDEVERRLVHAVDAADCGELAVVSHLKGQPEVPLSLCHISRVVAMYNPERSERRPEAYDDAFERATQMAGVLLVAQIKRSHAFLQAGHVVHGADDGGPVLLLDTYVPWHEHILAHHCFVLSPSLDGSGWMVETVQDDFVPRAPLPESWAGLRDQALAEVSGVPDAIFCHRARFIAAAKSKKGALKLVGEALKVHG